MEIKKLGFFADKKSYGIVGFFISGENLNERFPVLKSD